MLLSTIYKEVKYLYCNIAFFDQVRYSLNGKGARNWGLGARTYLMGMGIAIDLFSNDQKSR
jgi:hypothetical protein